VAVKQAGVGEDEPLSGIDVDSTKTGHLAPRDGVIAETTLARETSCLRGLVFGSRRPVDADGNAVTDSLGVGEP